MIRNVENWHEYVLHKHGLRRRDRFEFRIRGGLRADVPASTLFTFKEIFFTDDYFRGLPSDVPPRRPLSVLDIGANVGFFSLALFARFPGSRVVALEPIEANFRGLEANRALNPGLEWVTIRKAVHTGPEPLVLSLNPDDEFTTDATVWDNVRGDTTIEVPTITLADLLEHEFDGDVDYLKMDCEGSEYGILYDAPAGVLERVRTLVVETHPGPTERERLPALAAHLRDHGFRVATDRSAFIWAWREAR